LSRDAPTTIGGALEITGKAKGAKPLENNSTKSFGGQGRMENVHAQGHVRCYDAYFDPGHLVEGKSLHICGEKAHDLGSVCRN